MIQVPLAGKTYPFAPWTPDLGRVIDTAYAFDVETERIDDQTHWLVPDYVLGTTFDGRNGWFILRQHVSAFLENHQGLVQVFHHAVFDLAVLDRSLRADGSRLDVYAAVDQGHVRDTEILHRLHLLATAGHVGERTGEATLERCAQDYLGVALDKEAVDSQGDTIRLSYAKWRGQPTEAIEPAYLEYAAQDVVVTCQVYREVRRRILRVLEDASWAWGYVSPAWLEEQTRRHGLLTHDIQLKASIVLQKITANGLHVDLARRDELLADLDSLLADLRTELAAHGYRPGHKGCANRLQEILAGIEQAAGVRFRRTPTGNISAAQESLAEVAETDPFLSTYLHYKTTEKFRSTYVAKMDHDCIRASFRTLVRTGRTSSFRELNLQNLPRDDRVRMCFVPSPGHVFVDADYATVELATLAQTVLTQFGLPSTMAEAINRGEDLHRKVAARVTGKVPADVTREERQAAKAINFGKPGGMGSRTLRAYAKANYGVDRSVEQVAELEEAWLGLFPEMREYLGRDEDDDTGTAVARLLDLTPAAHAARTGDRRFVDHPENAGRTDEPHGILGRMALKVYGTVAPAKGNGRPYADADIAFFWGRLAQRIDVLPARRQSDVRDRRPSDELRNAVVGVSTARAVFTATGRLRAKATYCARHNTPFQGLAADGAKLALWLLWRAGYRVVNFIHDEVLVEIPETADLEVAAKRIRELLIAGMREVVPDVRIDVESVVTRRWAKAAEEVRDADGRLLPWEPAVESLA